MGELIQFPGPRHKHEQERDCCRCEHYRSIDLYLSKGPPRYRCRAKGMIFEPGDHGQAANCEHWQLHEFLPKDLG